ncbi:MAG: ATP-dependent zinc metalloprotease FtsH [Spirochaetales bacterium]|nr:ATP-dependent zinc metalloprotease FtsH [Spirochaetales bacterium]
MQHVKPDSFAGLESGNSSGNRNQDNGKKKQNDPDSYWRPRSSESNRNRSSEDNGQQGNPGTSGSGNGQGGGPGPFGSRKNRIGLIIFAALIILFAITLFSGNNNANAVPYSVFKDAVNSGSVASVNIKNNTTILFMLNSGVEYRSRIPYRDDNLLPLLESKGIVIEGSEADVSILAIVLELLPWLIFIGFTIMLLRQTSGNGQMMQFGKSHAKQYTDKDIKTTFKDVAGQKEAKYELEEVVEFLKNPKRYSEIGAKIPKGVLLVGPPGTGKTLIAKAVAGEAGVSFFHTSGSDFVEMFVGMGAARVRDLFDQGRKHAPCILFIDEIDAVGRSRGSGLGGGHDEREQTLNQILVEMDGFDTTSGVIVIAATNRADVLDPALLSPGRFDRQVAITLPDINEREDILRIHASHVKTDPEVDLKKIARATPGASGADLANLVNEAALFATRQNRRAVTMADFEQARDKMVLGVAKKSHVMTPDDKMLTAYHEGGHALLFYYLPDIDPLYKVTIIPHGNAGGVTMGLPENDASYMKKSALLSHIKMAMGGYIAEKLLNGQTSTGPSSDIKQATDIARRMVTEWGMSDLGFISLGSEGEPLFLGREIAQHKDFSEETAKKIDEQINKILNECMEDATRILTEHRDQLDTLAKALVARETLDDNDVRELLGFEAVGPKNSDIL